MLGGREGYFGAGRVDHVDSDMENDRNGESSFAGGRHRQQHQQQQQHHQPTPEQEEEYDQMDVRFGLDSTGKNTAATMRILGRVGGFEDSGFGMMMGNAGGSEELGGGSQGRGEEEGVDLAMRYELLEELGRGNFGVVYRA